MGRLIVLAQYLRAARQDYPREERRVVGYSENVLKQLKVTIVNSVKVVVEPYK